jgi:hypothetical protein
VNVFHNKDVANNVPYDILELKCCMLYNVSWFELCHYSWNFGLNVIIVLFRDVVQ